MPVKKANEGVIFISMDQGIVIINWSPVWRSGRTRSRRTFVALSVAKPSAAGQATAAISPAGAARRQLFPVACYADPGVASPKPLGPNVVTDKT